MLSFANRAAKRCKALLQTMMEETAAIKDENDKSKENELRIRENLSNTLSRKFVETVKEYQKRQQDYKDDVKKKVILICKCYFFGGCLLYNRIKLQASDGVCVPANTRLQDKFGS